MRTVVLSCIAALLLTGACITLKAQVILNRQVVSTTGGDGIVRNIHIQYSVGEAVVLPVTNGKTLLTQGFPRLVTVSRAALVTDPGQSDLPAAVLARVTLKDDDALVPDLAVVETRIREVMGKAA